MSSELIGLTTEAHERRWSADDSIINALSVGAGDDDPTQETFLTRSKMLVRGLSIAEAPDAPRRAADPAGDPDISLEVRTFPSRLLHRLLGDRNPLHWDPAVAARAGYDRPILHGLCTLGIAARAIRRVISPKGAGELRRMTARFTATVVPGDTLTVRAWRTGDGYSYIVSAGDRVVLDDGLLTLAAAVRRDLG